MKDLNVWKVLLPEQCNLSAPDFFTELWCPYPNIPVTFRKYCPAMNLLITCLIVLSGLWNLPFGKKEFLFHSRVRMLVNHGHPMSICFQAFRKIPYVHAIIEWCCVQCWSTAQMNALSWREGGMCNTRASSRSRKARQSAPQWVHSYVWAAPCGRALGAQSYGPSHQWHVRTAGSGSHKWAGKQVLKEQGGQGRCNKSKCHKAAPREQGALVGRPMLRCYCCRWGPRTQQQLGTQQRALGLGQGEAYLAGGVPVRGGVMELEEGPVQEGVGSVEAASAGSYCMPQGFSSLHQ